jgi:hypothetical protein
MRSGLTAKITEFCRALDGRALRDLACQKHQEEVLERAEEALRRGEIGAALEADIDALDEMMRDEYGWGLVRVTRGFSPLPPYPPGTGAQWWTCPNNRCDGRGRVLPGQQAPVCAATGQQLVPGPLPE